MPFEPLDTWASSYEETFSILFEDAAQPGFNSDAKTEEAWQTWYDGNIIDATCVAPIATAPTLTAVKDKLNFAPVQFVNPGTPDLAATVLSLAFAAYMNSFEPCARQLLRQPQPQPRKVNECLWHWRPFLPQSRPAPSIFEMIGFSIDRHWGYPKWQSMG